MQGMRPSTAIGLTVIFTPLAFASAAQEPATEGAIVCESGTPHAVVIQERINVPLGSIAPPTKFRVIDDAGRYLRSVEVTFSLCEDTLCACPSGSCAAGDFIALEP